MTNSARGVLVSLVGVMSLLLAACDGGLGDDTAGPQAPDEDTEIEEVLGEETEDGTGDAVTTGWGPSDSDWYLYGAQSMELVEDASGLSVTVQETSGSEENAIRMDEGEMDIGMVDVQGADAALDGEHDLTTLYPLALVLWQLVVAADTGIEDVEDLDGVAWNPGPVGGGSTAITVDVLENGFGVQPDYEDADLGDAVDAYTGRQIEGLSYRGAGVRATGALLEADSARTIDLISFTDEQMEVIAEVNPDLAPATIPGGTYESVEEDVQTFGYWGVIVGARGDLDEGTAYEVTSAFWENIDAIHERLPETEQVTPETAVEQAILPFHPGAARYYEEDLGMELPDELKAD